MAVSVVMPALEMAQETGKLVNWLKKEGEQVSKGEMLIEIETDKAVVEVEAQGDGVLGGITAKEGDVVPVGHTIGWLLQPGEEAPRAADVTPTQTGRRTDVPKAPAAPVAAAPVAAAAGRRLRVSPKARRLATELGVDLASVRSSGDGGDISADDIRAAATAASPSAAPAGATVEQVSTVGRLMAERTTASWTTAPHFFVSRDVEATALNAARARLVPEVERSHQVRLTHTDLLVAAVGRALRTHTRLNASWSKDGIANHADVHVALAMAVADAVVTAVIRNADRAGLGEIAAQRRELTERARAGRLQLGDISGATFTISNLGMYGVDAFTAIIVPPQAAILAVGAIADRVVAVGGEAAVRPYMTMTLSADHRVVDGARAASFLGDVVTAIREPEAWLA